MLLERGRAREAVDVVSPALFGSLEASNGYITRTELHDLLARAFDALHEADSAASHYRSVVGAWTGADQQFRGRYAIAQSRLAQLAR